MIERQHVHVWVHVGTPQGVVCKCVCGRTLSPSQIISMRKALGVAS